MIGFFFQFFLYFLTFLFDQWGSVSISVLLHLHSVALSMISHHSWIMLWCYCCTKPKWVSWRHILLPWSLLHFCVSVCVFLALANKQTIKNQIYFSSYSQNRVKKDVLYNFCISVHTTWNKLDFVSLQALLLSQHFLPANCWYFQTVGESSCS